MRFVCLLRFLLKENLSFPRNFLFFFTCTSRVDTKLFEEHVQGDAIVPTLHNSNEKQKKTDLIEIKKVIGWKYKKMATWK